MKRAGKAVRKRAEKNKVCPRRISVWRIKNSCYSPARRIRGYSYSSIQRIKKYSNSPRRRVQKHSYSPRHRCQLATHPVSQSGNQRSR